MEKVRQGEAVSIKAATWNSFVDAAEFAKKARRLVGADGVVSGLSGNMVYVRNAMGGDVPRFGALVLSEPVIQRESASEDFECETPAFEGVPAEDKGEGEEEKEKDSRPFAVAVEPIPSGEIGRALVFGVTPAKVEVVHEEDACAEPVPGSSTGELRSTNVGYARIVWKEEGTGEKWCFLRLGASEPRADEKSVSFAKRDPESESAEDEDAEKTEKLEIKGFCSKKPETKTLGESLSKKDESSTDSEEKLEDEVIVRSGDRKTVKFMKIGRVATGSNVEVDDVSVDFAKEDDEDEGSEGGNPDGGGSEGEGSESEGSEGDESGGRSNKVQVFGFDSQDAEEATLADNLAEQDVECDDEVVVRAADRKSLKYIRIGNKLATVLEAGENVTITQEGNTITISAEGGAEPGDFVTSGYSTAEGESDVEIADIRYYGHDLQVRKAVKTYENGLLKTRVLGDWETFTTAVEETV